MNGNINSSPCADMALTVNGYRYMKAGADDGNGNHHLAADADIQIVRIFHAIPNVAQKTRVGPLCIAGSDQEPGKRKPWRPLACKSVRDVPVFEPVCLSGIRSCVGKPKPRKAPGRKAPERKRHAFEIRMLAEYVVRGFVRLRENHPRFEEAKATLLRKGFRYDGERKAWVPDPDWVPQPA